MTLIALSFSGGLDSAAAWWAFGKPNWFFVTGGNPHVTGNEVKAVEQLCIISPEFKAKGQTLDIDLSPFRAPGKWVFPRASLLAFLGVGLGYKEIWFALQAWDVPVYKDHHDTYNQFLRDEYDDPSIIIRNISGELGRTELVRRAQLAGCPDEFLLATWSCHRDGKYHCGECNNCAERAVTFTNLGIKEKYMSDPLTNGSGVDMVLRADRLNNPDFIREYKKAKGLPENEPIYV